VRKSPTARRRLVESGLWLVVAGVGVFVLLPAVVELIDARRMEEHSRQRAQDSGTEMQDEMQKARALVDDSDATEKLGPAQGLDTRRHQEAIPPEPPDDPAASNH